MQYGCPKSKYGYQNIQDCGWQSKMVVQNSQRVQKNGGSKRLQGRLRGFFFSGGFRSLKPAFQQGSKNDLKGSQEPLLDIKGFQGCPKEWHRISRGLTSLLRALRSPGNTWNLSKPLEMPQRLPGISLILPETPWNYDLQYQLLFGLK